jgi:hypothetical protein
MVSSRKLNNSSTENSLKAIGNEPRAIKPRGAPTPRRSGSAAGFLFVVILVGLLGYVLGRVIYSAGMVEWRLSIWESIAISAIFVTLRAIDRIVFGYVVDRNGTKRR